MLGLPTLNPEDPFILNGCPLPRAAPSPPPHRSRQSSWIQVVTPVAMCSVN